MSEPRDILRRAFAAEENSAAALEEGALARHAGLARRMFRTPVLAVREMLAPGAADLAGAVTRGVDVYRTMFFVSVLRLDMLYVAAILALIGIWDVLNDPLAGILYDRTRTRWGKSRPFLLLAPLPMYLSTALLYCGGLLFPGGDTGDPRKILFVFLTLFAEDLFKTLYNPAKGNYLALMTPNPDDRIRVGLVSRYTDIIGARLVFLFVLPVMDLNAHGLTDISMASVFAVLAAAAAAAGTAGSAALAFGTRERVLLQPRPADTHKALFYMLKNKYAMRNFAASFATSWYGTGGYSWDVVTQMEIMGGVIPSFLSNLPYEIINFASVAFVPLAVKRFGGNKRGGMLFFTALDIARSGLQCLCGVLLIRRPLWFCLVFALFWAVNAADNAPSSVIEAEMNREIADYTEYMTGERPDGTQGLLPGLIMKVTAPLNALFTVAVFRWSGYNPLIPMGPYSQNNFAVYQKAYFLYILADCLPKLVKLIPYALYDLVGEKREKMYLALNERRALVAAAQLEEGIVSLEAALTLENEAYKIANKEEQPA